MVGDEALHLRVAGHINEEINAVVCNQVSDLIRHPNVEIPGALDRRGGEVFVGDADDVQAGDLTQQVKKNGAAFPSS